MAKANASFSLKDDEKFLSSPSAAEIKSPQDGKSLQGYFFAPLRKLSLFIAPGWLGFHL